MFAGQPLEGPVAGGQVDDNRPPACICNLCQCGTHRCSNFSWNAQLAASLAHCQDQSEADRMKAPEVAERYLTRPVREASPQLVGQEGDETELLHVLVTRPEIACKPRDNIVLEGDMDLRTTFETSYEALARMRLDQWRRHQETAKARDISSVSVHAANGRQRAKNRMPTTAAGQTTSTAAPLNGAGKRARRTKPAGTGARQLCQASEGENELVHEVDELAIHHPEGEHYLHDTPKRAMMAAGSVAPQVEKESEAEEQMRPTPISGRGQVVRSPPPPPPPPLVMSSPISRRRSPGVTRPAVESAGVASVGRRELAAKQQQQQWSQQINTTDLPLDPDLSSIICYDANMNRLERVGLRKRSKYRPSTSLRPGARGFFGDAPDEEATKLVDQSTDCAHPDGAPQNRKMGAAGASSDELEQKLGPNALGRKHLLGHANRTDHIKEQDIVEHRQLEERHFEDKATLTERLARQSLVVATAAAADEHELERRLADEEESAVVAEIQRCTREAPEALESGNEAAANGQSHSITPQAQQQQQQQQSRANSRQSRQQRVCQNQSFYINENDYPATRNDLNDDFCIKIGGRETATSQRDQNSASPMQLNVGRAKNLFRESPDFILTTGQASSSQSTRQASAAVQNGAAEINTNLISETRAAAAAAAGSPSQQAQNGHRSSQALDSSEKAPVRHGHEQLVEDNRQTGSSTPFPYTSSCRVLNLDNRYEFVGSQSGHKYFVERHLDTLDVDSRSMLVRELA